MLFKLQELQVINSKYWTQTKRYELDLFELSSFDDPFYLKSLQEE